MLIPLSDSPFLLHCCFPLLVGRWRDHTFTVEGNHWYKPMVVADRLAEYLAVELVEGTPSGAGRQDRHFLRQQDRRDALQSLTASTHA
jgi:hypothetical protein